MNTCHHNLLIIFLYLELKNSFFRTHDFKHSYQVGRKREKGACKLKAQLSTPEVKERGLLPLVDPIYPMVIKVDLKFTLFASVFFEGIPQKHN